MLPGLISIACYLSPNPLPLDWMLSGPKGSLAPLEAMVRSTPGAAIVDRASGKRDDFTRIRFSKTMLYGDFMGIMNVALASDVLRSTIGPLIPNCPPDARLEDVGNPHAPVEVGVFGAAEGLTRFREEVTWATIADVTLDDGRTGLRFVPSSEQADRYEAFAVQASAAKFAGVEIVLLRVNSTAQANK